VTDCIANQLEEVVDRIIEERDALLSGDFSILKKALAAAAVKYAIDEASRLDSELGEMLDTLEKVCTQGNGACF
jgi:hypothetical protein